MFKVKKFDRRADYEYGILKFARSSFQICRVTLRLLIAYQFKEKLGPSQIICSLFKFNVYR